MRKCPRCGRESLATETEILPDGLKLTLKCANEGDCGYSTTVPHGQELKYFEPTSPLYGAWKEYLSKPRSSTRSRGDEIRDGLYRATKDWFSKSP